MKHMPLQIAYFVAVLGTLCAAFVYGCGDDETVVVAPPLSPIHFDDPNLEDAVRDALDKPSGNIYQRDLRVLTSLHAPGRTIQYLGGLQYCTNLAYLDLQGNLIADIVPLGELTGLTHLYLRSNAIVYLTPLETLLNLSRLDLGFNQIQDITPLRYNSDHGGLGPGDYVTIDNNLLNSQAINDIIYLQGKGVSVTY